MKPESTALLERPSYLYFLHVFQSADMDFSGLPIDNEGIITKSILNQTQKSQQNILYTIPSFHNPTGFIMLDSRRPELLKVCKEERIPIIEDDIYRELWIDKEPPNKRHAWSGSLSWKSFKKPHSRITNWMDCRSTICYSLSS